MRNYFFLLVLMMWLPGCVKEQQQATVQQEDLLYPEGDSINIRDLVVHDPCILADSASGTYYIYEKFSPSRFQGLVENAPKGKAGVFFQASKDLVSWSRPKAAFVIPDTFWADDDAGPWAPEVHQYHGKYYLFATFNAWGDTLPPLEGRPPITRRASQILVSPSPEGPFVPFHNSPSTPDGEMTLDATLWVDNGQPWMVYCHEWVQLGNGLIKAIRLTDDLSETVGEPITLLNAADVAWTRKNVSYHGTRYPGAVTDGPYLYRSFSGKLMMVWSSWSTDRKYALALATSESNTIEGPWIHEPEPLLQDDRGHGMIFTDFEGRLLLCLHRYFHYPDTRVQLYELEDLGQRLQVKGQILGAE
ncbi:MAG: glycoside hydrolase family 43 protein [Bacteroidia bacterium]|nr:glycoside hydrolase family 43 protein [Bacteroidia bacterium]